MAMKMASKNTMMTIHSERGTKEITEPPFIRADGQEHDVQDGDGFQAQGIAQVHQEVDAQYEEEFIADPPGQSKAGDQEQAADDQGDGRRYCAGGQGAFAFCRVFPVVFPVPVVVYDVDAAGYEGKCNKSV
jgi:hypothetical protein